MPHKRNPILSEQVSGLARVVRCNIIPAYENAIQWHERDLTNSSSERFILPHSLILTDWIVYLINDIFKNLKVFPEKMIENLEKSQGLPMAEAVMTKLVEKGLGRGEAHELTRTCSQKAITEKKDLYTILISDKNVSKYLNKKELNELIDPKNYLGVTDKIIDNIMKKLSR
jgi:adenylosuccinate lyase